jgi:hypothetical protein
MSNTLWPAPVQSVLECKIPHELDARKWKAIGRRRREEEVISSTENGSLYVTELYKIKDLFNRHLQVLL